jgi:hypothetical protein
MLLDHVIEPGRRCWMEDGVGWKTVLDGRRCWMEDGAGWRIGHILLLTYVPFAHAQV